ncbi:MAG: hypothetical protein KJO05_01910 [Bacteroidia bacterium]|nr:hypothetical protein [Bacteroidia bacterium]NNF29983.1 hypothetical protein [Flavobacteriaceae bacterium]MBT8276037.1 hypothetical protein [Bacteroidia bacterium]NNJ80880.1 hypothetical protein [Flavobacteriaceae bacterium]NNK53688.1 hypothetical protein [Flavobacteriaceae bacterium]
MKKITLLLVFVCCISATMAQVGINSSEPSADLEVDGDVLLDDGLYLEDPGDNTNIRGSKFLVNTVANELSRYDINLSKYGPINYVEFKFSNLSADGLLDYDTKISTTDYLVSVQGYSCGIAGAGRTGSIMPHSLISDDNIEGYQIYAYPNLTTKTWFLRAFVNNSEWQKSGATSYINTEIDMWLNIMIYRKGFIAKEQNNITVDMSNSATGTATLPAGF